MGLYRVRTPEGRMRRLRHARARPLPGQEGAPPLPAVSRRRGPAHELIDLVVARDPGVDRAAVEQALSSCSRQRAVRRGVAWAVLDHPDLLTGAGHPAPTPSVLAFINALVDAGATEVKRPGCARCGAPDRLRAKQDGQRICWRCEQEARAPRTARAAANTAR